MGAQDRVLPDRVLPDRVLIVGCGNMGGAMLAGWLAGGLDPARFAVVDPVLAEVPAGVALRRELPVGESFSTVLLGVKPQLLGAVAPGLEPLVGPETVLLSILAGADLAVVEFADRRHFGGGAGEEGFVGAVDFVAGDALFDDLDAQFAGQLHDGGAGDAFEAGGQVRRVQLAVPDDEQVLAGPFAGVAFRIEQQGFVVAVAGGLVVGEDGVHVVARGLGANHRDVHMVAGVGRGLDADAALHAFLAEVGAPRPGGDDDVHLGALGRNAHFLGAVEGQRAQVARFEIVGADDFLLGFVQVLGRVGHLHLEDVGRTEQALGVLL